MTKKAIKELILKFQIFLREVPLGKGLITMFNQDPYFLTQVLGQAIGKGGEALPGNDHEVIQARQHKNSKDFKIGTKPDKLIENIKKL